MWLLVPAHWTYFWTPNLHWYRHSLGKHLTIGPLLSCGLDLVVSACRKCFFSFFSPGLPDCQAFFLGSTDQCHNFFGGIGEKNTLPVGKGKEKKKNNKKNKIKNLGAWTRPNGRVLLDPLTQYIFLVFFFYFFHSRLDIEKIYSIFPVLSTVFFQPADLYAPSCDQPGITKTGRMKL